MCRRSRRDSSVCAAVGFPEKLRVAQPRRDDALGVLGDEALVGRLRIDDGEKRFLDAAGIGQDREPVLMMHERRRQHFFRKDEKRGVEEAGDDRRVLDEIGNLLDERRMILQMHSATKAAGVTFEIAGDAVASFRMIEDNEMFGQLGLILVEAANLDRAAGAAARGQKPMAVGQRSGLDVLDLRARGAWHTADGVRHDAAAIQKQQPANRPPEQQLATPVVEPGVPVHLLGEREIAKQAREDVGQRIDGTSPALVLLERQVLALRVSWLESAARTARPASWQSPVPPGSAGRPSRAPPRQEGR